MRVEGVCDVQVVGYEVAQPVTGEIRTVWLRSVDSYIGTSGLSVNITLMIVFW